MASRQVDIARLVLHFSTEMKKTCLIRSSAFFRSLHSDTFRVEKFDALNFFAYRIFVRSFICFGFNTSGTRKMFSAIVGELCDEIIDLWALSFGFQSTNLRTYFGHHS